MKGLTLSEFRAAIRNGPYAWPGGYPLFFVMADGESLSFKAAKAERRLIIESIARPEFHDKQWLPIACVVNWENDSLYCCHTGETIESAYECDYDN